jgi:hypothetical protein
MLAGEGKFHDVFHSIAVGVIGGAALAGRHPAGDHVVVKAFSHRQAEHIFDAFAVCEGQ